VKGIESGQTKGLEKNIGKNIEINKVKCIRTV
jgi:hypothetical protein